MGMLRRYYNHKSKLVDRSIQVDALIRSFAICLTQALRFLRRHVGASGMQLESDKRAEPARQRHDSIRGLAARCLKWLLCTKPCKSCPAADCKAVPERSTSRPYCFSIKYGIQTAAMKAPAIAKANQLTSFMAC